MAQPITDHVERGLSRLIEQYKGKPRIQGFLESWLEELQELSDQIWAVILNRLIDHAEGVHLQTIGKIVGQHYRGEEQERYRVFVRARVAVNISAGRINDLIRVASIALNGPAHSVMQLYPATVHVDISEPTDFGAEVFELLFDAKAGGVALTLTWFDGGDALTWSDGDSFEDDEDRGFGGDDPDVGPGGFLIGAF